MVYTCILASSSVIHSWSHSDCFPPWARSWSWSYGSWIYNYLCNQCLSSLMLSVWILLVHMPRCAQYNYMWQVCQWIATCGWFLWTLRFPPPTELSPTI